jgi:Ca-activated chloride channel family protein
VADGAGLDRDALAERITSISLRHRVLCRFTAFVAVDESGHPVEGDLHRIVQPVEQPAGWAPLAALAMPAGAGAAGPPVTIPDRRAYRPSAPTGSPPPIRAARPVAGARRLHHAAPEAGSLAAVVDLQTYRDRWEELLAAIDRDAPAEVARAARQLADDLESVGITGPVVEALRSLAEALASGDGQGVKNRAAELRQLFREGQPDRRNQPFWRR